MDRSENMDSEKDVDLSRLPLSERSRIERKNSSGKKNVLFFLLGMLVGIVGIFAIGHPFAKDSYEVSEYKKVVAQNDTLKKENESLTKKQEESEKKLFNILQRSIGGDYVPIQQVVLNAVSNIEKASKLKGSVTGIPTGFVDLDYKTSGMHASDLVLIAARPSMGKTAFVLNIAQYMAFRKDVTVAIFSLEMSKEQLVNRLLAMESHVDSQNLRTGNLKDEDWTKLVEGADIIGGSNLIIDDTPGISIAELRSKCRKYKLCLLYTSPSPRD